MEYSCNDKPLISNLSPDTVMENSNTTQEVASTDQPAPAQTQSGSLLTARFVFQPFSVKTNDGGFNTFTTNSELPFGSCSLHHTVQLEEKTDRGKRWHLYQEVCAKIRGYPVQKVQ